MGSPPRSDAYGPVAAASVVGLLTIAAFTIDPAPYREVLGGRAPGLTAAALIVCGVPALIALHRSGLFAFSQRQTRRRGLFAAAALAFMFAALVVTVDVVVRFPQAYNVPPRFPQSPLFYATIGYVAEMAFHVIPLALIVLLGTARSGAVVNETRLRFAMVVIACCEPLFQLRLGMPGGGTSATWLQLFVVMQVFAINVVQLGLYRQFDFLTAYAFRLVYYLLWHVVWGPLRQALFY